MKSYETAPLCNPHREQKEPALDMLAQTLKLCEVDFGEFDDPDYPTIIQHSATQVNHFSALGFGQCCGSVTFWYGFGSADPPASY
jgi:hypothetical protein